MSDFEAVLAGDQGPAILAAVTRLYRVVLGRPPDSGGLRAHAVHLGQGTALAVLVDAFLASDEFARQVGAGTRHQALLRNALGDAAPADPRWAEAPAPRDLALTLLQSPEVARRFPVLPTLFPDGLLLEGADDYRVWLAGRPPAEPTPGDAPSVSFIMPLDREDPAQAMATLDSVLQLDWPDLEVLVCTWDLGPELRARATEDRRVRLVRTPPWSGPDRRFGHGLARCRGSFAAPIRAGDRLDRHAAPAVAAALAGADLVLSDEDAIGPDGLRHGPRFGEAWDRDRALAAGRPGLVLARTALLRRAMPWRRNATAYALLLRAARLAPAERILHVPALLLSRPAPTPPPGAAEIGEARAQLSAAGERGCTVRPGPHGLRVVHPVPEPPPPVSVVIATRNRAELLAACVDGLLTRTDYPALEVVIVDNGSDEPAALSLLDRLARDARVRVLSRPGPFNWAALNNAGVAAMSGTVAVLLNNDTAVLEPGWLREMVSHAIRPDVGAVGAKLLYPDGTVQHAGVVFDTRGHALHMWRRRPADDPGYLGTLATVREVSAVTGACLAIRREVYDAVGGCNAADLPVTWNDVDLCLRVREHGLRVIWTPHARLLHLEQASRGSDDTPENDARFRREQAWMRARWKRALMADPFLNANMAYSETGLRLAAQPGPPLPASPGLVR